MVEISDELECDGRRAAGILIWFRFAITLSAALLIVAHGCHSHEDTELRLRPLANSFQSPRVVADRGDEYFATGFVDDELNRRR